MYNVTEGPKTETGHEEKPSLASIRVYGAVIGFPARHKNCRAMSIGKPLLLIKEKPDPVLAAEQETKSCLGQDQGE